LLRKPPSHHPKVCFLTDRFLPSIGGTERHAYQLAEKLITKGCKVFVVTRQTIYASTSLERIGNVLVRRIPSRNRLKGAGWKALWPILMLLARTLIVLIRERNQFDVLLVSGLKTYAIPATLACWILRKSCIIKIEVPTDLWEDISSESLKRMRLSPNSLLLQSLCKLRHKLVKKATAFIAISAEIRKGLINIGIDRRKIHYIPNGIDVNVFHPVSAHEKLRIRQRLSLPPNSVIITFSGRLVTSKGLPLLLEVWNNLTKTYQEISLLLVGSGKNSIDNAEPYLENDLYRSKLGKSLFVVGEVSNVHEYLQASDIFVFPSEYEGFSLALAEALACGLPTIATNVGAASEIIKHSESGILTEPKNKEDLFNCLNWMMTNKSSWSSIGNNGRENIVKKYRIDVIVGEYENLFLKLDAETK
jgi:glycosyltransferase involved in cell wall biosynthesis